MHSILRNRKKAQRKRTVFVRKVTKFFRYMKIKKQQIFIFMDNMQKEQEKNKEATAVEFLQSAGIGGVFVPPPPRGYVEVLAREFDASTRAVSMALQGVTMTRQAIMIRKRYMEKYVQPYLK